MTRLSQTAAITIALLTLSIGRAFALSVTMAPPQGNAGSAIACPALATILAGTNNVWTVTDAQCIRSNLSNGWTVVQTPQVLSNAATSVMDLSKGCSGTLAFASGTNVTLTATNIAFCVGKPVVVYTTQPASGTTTNTLTFSTGFTLNSSAPTLKTGTSATDSVAFADNGTALMYPLGGSTVVSGAKSWLTGSSNAVVSNSAANFVPISGAAAPQATNEGDVSTVATTVATIKNLKCVLTTAVGVVTVAGGTNYVLAVDQNLVASALTCTIAAAASSCTDTTHTLTTAVGDQLDVLSTPSGSPTALVVKCSVEVDM